LYAGFIFYLSETSLAISHTNLHLHTSVPFLISLG